MITPALAGAAELAAKLDAIPEAIRTALAHWTAGVPPARLRPKSAHSFVLRTVGVPPAPSLTLPRLRGREGWGQIRAAIETAIQQVLQS